MKIRTRIMAIVASVIATISVATPALAAEPHVGTSQYSSAGQPVDIVAISIVMIVLLVVTVGGGALVGKLFDKKA